MAFVVGLLVSVLMFATLPAILALTARKYRSYRLGRSAAARQPEHPAMSEPRHAATWISVIPAAGVPASTHGARIEAISATRDARLAHVIAAVLYGAIVFASILWLVRLPQTTRVAVAYASLAPQLLILVWMLRAPLRRATWAFLIYGVVGIALVSLSAAPVRILAWSLVFPLMIIPAVVILCLRVIEVITDEHLHIHLLQLGLTIYFELWASLSTQFVDTRFTFAFALACSIATQHVLLFLIRARRSGIVEQRLLYLRTFAGLDARQDVLDDLSDTWRRIGTVELFAGPDVATRAIRPVLSIFARRSPRLHYLFNKQDVPRQVAQLDVKIEGDARYPLNAIYSPDDVWEHAFPLLEKNAGVVLMDLRGFTRHHRGCKGELEHLRDHRKLRGVVLLTDRQTDFRVLEAILDGHEVEVLDYGHPSSEERRALFDLLLNAAYG